MKVRSCCYFSWEVWEGLCPRVEELKVGMVGMAAAVVAIGYWVIEGHLVEWIGIVCCLKWMVRYRRPGEGTLRFCWVCVGERSGNLKVRMAVGTSGLEKRCCGGLKRRY
jgi:hypothetical protein